jgi:hypothetical protein
MTKIEDSLQKSRGISAIDLCYYICSLNPAASLQEMRSLTIYCQIQTLYSWDSSRQPLTASTAKRFINKLLFPSRFSLTVNRLLILYAQVIHKIQTPHITPGNREFFIAVFSPGA